MLATVSVILIKRFAYSYDTNCIVSICHHTVIVILFKEILICSTCATWYCYANIHVHNHVYNRARIIFMPMLWGAVIFRFKQKRMAFYFGADFNYPKHFVIKRYNAETGFLFCKACNFTIPPQFIKLILLLLKSRMKMLLEQRRQAMLQQ